MRFVYVCFPNTAFCCGQSHILLQVNRESSLTLTTKLRALYALQYTDSAVVMRLTHEARTRGQALTDWLIQSPQLSSEDGGTLMIPVL